MNRNTLLIGLLILLLALASSWLSRNSGGDSEGEVVSNAQLPDYYINGLTLSSLDKSGEPAHLLEAERLVHFPDDGHTELEQVRFELLLPGAPNWRVSADAGSMPADQSHIDFSGHVLIERVDKSLPPLRLSTEQLLIDPRGHYARSDSAIRIESRDTLLQAEGLEIDFTRRTLTLLANIRGRYEPTSD